ncbi:C40 family peptidase [Bacillus sp. JJ1764]|uniref:C40 family peptidase n=1 Tax=Bacillus sp. JJ1764 TaxID=3122964 RepID=UPI0030005FED
MIKKIFKYSISLAVVASMIQATPTFASPVNTPVTQGQINETQGQIDTFETKMQQLDDQISTSMEKSQQLNNQITEQQAKIEETKAEIDAAKKSLELHKQVYSERLKSIQSEGKDSLATYAELLLSSNNISDFLSRFTAISKILESDSDLLNGLNEKEQALKTAEEKLHSELDSLNKSKEELAAEQRKIEADKQEITKALADAQTLLQSQQAQLAVQQAEAQRQAQLAAQAAAAQAAAPTQQQPGAPAPSGSSPSVPKSTPSFGTADPADPGSAGRLIAIAKQYLGVPYVWGGTTPSGFDCSGFTSYVFRQIGINLPRVSRDQQNVGIRISPSQVQPGDLVFRGYPAYHVGIYIGGGQYIHAPQTGDVVKIASYNPASFSTAARVLR